MTSGQITHIDPLSATSLRLEVVANNQALGMATGFVVEHSGVNYLVTNWHVLSGRNTESGRPVSQSCAIPDAIRIVHHHDAKLGHWIIKTEALCASDGSPLWREHPSGSDVDIAALPLAELTEVQLYPFDLGLADTDMLPQVAMPVAIIGYPFGLATGTGWPIWKTGHIASDPDLDYDGKPSFLIDATTRGGMSGSPVVLRLTGGYPTRSGSFVLGSGPATTFLGVYSGRIHEDVEVGRVWRPHLIQEVLSP